MAWDRICRVVVRTPVGPGGGNYTEVDLTTLHVDFNITRSRVFSDNEAKLNIYNEAPDFIRRVLQRGSNLLVYAGHKDEGEGLVYQGNIVGVTSIKTGTDVVTSVMAMSLRSLDKPFTSTPVVLNFEPGATADEVIIEIGARLGLVPIGANNVKGVEFPQGWAFVGPVGLAIERIGRDIMVHGYGLYIDLAELVVYSTQADSDYTLAYLHYGAGLLSIKDTTDYVAATRGRIEEMGQTKRTTTGTGKNKKVIISTEASNDVYSELEKVFTSLKKTLSAQTIMMPKVRPNSLVHVDTPEHSGLFVVDRMTIQGGNYAGAAFVMDLELLEA